MNLNTLKTFLNHTVGKRHKKCSKMQPCFATFLSIFEPPSSHINFGRIVPKKHSKLDTLSKVEKQKNIHNYNLAFLLQAQHIKVEKDSDKEDYHREAKAIKETASINNGQLNQTEYTSVSEHVFCAFSSRKLS